ncbi:MAG: exodeoxyribonuclease VII small subunit [Lachnospiraceae bacterium]|nr:exodeoxyribonuclease VII small subunit [Lachnospira sp.]MBR6696968.1 exodeoxyribonuclease VII small subunit [Lachnospiraceae bacterium]
MSTELTLENAMEQLEELITKLEDGEISLEEAFNLYSEGVKLTKYCNEQLQGVEKQITILNEDDDNE